MMTPFSASISFTEIRSADRNEDARDQKAGGKRKEKWDDSLEN
jgi:hypothetical protein